MSRTASMTLPFLLILATGSGAFAAAEGQLTADQAVALALSRNRDIIAARLAVEAVEVERIAATVYRNPDVSYSLGNVVLGRGNDQCSFGASKCVNPGPFDQPIHSLGITQVLDVWSKRGLRREAAERSIEESRLRVDDAIREVVYAVRTAFTEVAREQSERDLARETRDRYAETIRLSTARFKAGDISENELHKVELEGLKYENAALDEEMEFDEARYRLAALLSLPAESISSVVAVDVSTVPPASALAQLVERAMSERPDMLAARKDQARAEALLRAERREPYPDPALGVGYIYDQFQVAGDNPNTLAVTIGFPIPIFNRNQAGVQRANVEIRAAENEAQKLAIEIQLEVHEAMRRVSRARAELDIFEGGMLQRAERALQVGERSYKIGAITLIELLEARRTNIETHRQYLRTQHDFRQALYDLAHAIGHDIR